MSTPHSVDPSGDVLYRYDVIHYSLGVDEIGDPLPGHRLEVRLSEYPVVKRTPQGAWIDAYGIKPRFVRLTAHKQYACETPELAAESFRARKQRQIRILRAQLSDAEQALAMMNDGRVDVSELSFQEFAL